jgi:hypothetical protein
VALTRGQQASASVIDERLVVAAAADLELVPARSPARRVAQAAIGALIFFLLMLAGAAIAAWVFQSRFGQLLGR